MKVIRVIKWIAFVAFIVAFLFSATATGFIYADLIKTEKDNGSFSLQSFIVGDNQSETSSTMSEIKSALAAADLSFMDVVRHPMQKYGVKAEADPTVEPEVTPTPAADATAPEATPETEPTTEPTVVPDTTASASGSAAYDLTKHSNLVTAVMKYGSASREMNWLGFAKLDKVSINVHYFASLCALIVSFLMLIISKPRKTVYGTFLMILGFLFFLAFSYLGLLTCKATASFADSLVSTDWSRIKSFIVIVFSFLGLLIGVPIYSCGMRQITNKRLRRKLSRRGLR